MSLPLLRAMRQHIMYVCLRCFQCMEVYFLALETTLTQYIICCHIARNNEIFIILTRDFSKEQYVLPEDDMRYAIETCRSSESVLV